MPGTRWSDDEFLDGLRRSADPLADAAVARLWSDGGRTAVTGVFAMLKDNACALPASCPPAITSFLSATSSLPPVDMAQLELGGRVFCRHALPAVVVMLASSLPRGYGAPCLNEILSISGNLRHHPYERLMGVVQLLVNISDHAAFGPHGRAIVTAQKLRLLHAGVRALTREYRPAYESRFGVPVNHEDMLATIMAFSYLVVDGLSRLGLPLERDDAQAFHSLWRTFALLMGIHPDGRPDDDSLVPATLDESAEFYAAYVRRHNVTPPAPNAMGVALTAQNLAMMRHMLPWPARLVGLGMAPRVCMTELMTPEELARVGVRPLPGHRAVRAWLHHLLGLGAWAGTHTTFAGRLAHAILQGMVDLDRRGQVEFSIPFSRLDLRGAAFR